MAHNRRDLAATDETTLSQEMSRALQFVQEEESSSFEPPSQPSATLKRTLSVKSVVSTASSFAERMNRDRARTSQSQELRDIGLGSCGSVFEIRGTQLAYKKGTDTASIWNDFRMTNTVHNAVVETQVLLQEAFPQATIPRTPMAYEFMLPDSDIWWKANLTRFPKSHRKRGAVYLADRILPLPQQVREALIQIYFDDSEAAQAKALSDMENDHCLARMYLGERETPEQKHAPYESLRNFPMRLNMIEDLDLDASGLASEMAIGLAILHWQAQVDGMDTEFVLGSATETLLEDKKGYDTEGPPREVYRLNFKRRSIHVWMLDFDKATKFELKEEELSKKLVPAFLGNDPYFPRPDVDEEIWTHFSREYLTASHVILKSRGLSGNTIRLPQLFLRKVEEMIKKHEDWDPEEEIVFG